MAQRLVAEADRQERLLALEQPVDGAAQRRHLRVVAVARVAGSGPDDRPGRSRRGRRRRSSSWRTTSLVMPSTPRTWRSMFTKSSSPSRITDPLAGQRRVRRRRRPGRSARTCSAAVAGVEGDQHVLVVDQLGDALGRGAGAGGTRPKAERMPPALACVSATSYAGSESRTSVAPAVTLSRPSRSTSAVRITIGLSTIGRAVARRGRAARARRRSSRGPRTRTA